MRINSQRELVFEVSSLRHSSLPSHRLRLYCLHSCVAVPLAWHPLEASDVPLNLRFLCREYLAVAQSQPIGMQHELIPTVTHRGTCDIQACVMLPPPTLAANSLIRRYGCYAISLKRLLFGSVYTCKSLCGKRRYAHAVRPVASATHSRIYQGFSPSPLPMISFASK